MANAENTISALTVEDINVTINHEPRILDIRLAAALGFKKPRDIRPLIDRHNDGLLRFGEVCRTARQTSGKGGRPTREIWLTKKQALFICTKSETERATEVTIQMVEVFDEVTNRQRAVTAPTTNVVKVSSYERKSPTKTRTISNASRREFFHQQIAEAQIQLFRMGEIFPTVVREACSLRDVFGALWPIDGRREVLQLPDGGVVLPIIGGGWQYEPRQIGRQAIR